MNLSHLKDVPVALLTETPATKVKRKKLMSSSTPGKRVPKSAAVLDSGKEKDFSYADALKLAREKISLRELGIESTRIKTAFNGGLFSRP